jgi:hypothetical protein
MNKFLILLSLLFFISILKADCPYEVIPKAEAIMKDGSHIVGYFDCTFLIALVNSEIEGSIKSYSNSVSTNEKGTDLMPRLHPRTTPDSCLIKYTPDYARTKYGDFVVQEEIKSIDLNCVNKLKLLEAEEFDAYIALSDLITQKGIVKIDFDRGD